MFLRKALFPLLLFACLTVPDRARAQHFVFHGEGPAVLATQALLENGPLPSIEIRLSVPSLDLLSDPQDNGFTHAVLPGTAPLGAMGAPDLPATGTLLAVPDGYRAELTVLSQDIREIPNVSIRPAQRRMRCDCAANRLFFFDAGLYASSALYPAKSFALEEVGYLQGLRLQRVALHPLQMNMGSRSLRVTTDLVLRVRFHATTASAAPIVLPRALYDLAREAAANGRYLGPSVVPAPGPETLLVFVADALRPAVDPLVEWKRAKGLRVEVSTLTQVGGTKEKLKAFIQSYYDSHSPKPSYLLFVGDKQTMPPFMEEVTTSDDGPAASDYRFSLLSGADPVPDVLYGRVVANTIEEARAQVSRWIEYEKSPERQADWYTKAITLASSEGFNPSDEDYASQVETALHSHTYHSIDRFYERTGSATTVNIRTAVQEGRSWIAYFGHGSGVSWPSTNDEFDVKAIEALSNSRLPIVIDVACDNASYQVIAKPFGKAWVTQTNGSRNAGALAYYGASVSVTWDPPAVMSVGLAKAHFEKPQPSLGGTALGGQLYLIQQQGTGVGVTDNLKWYNLFGDPSLLLRTSIPLAFQVKTEISHRPGGTSVELSAVDSTGKGVGALLASIDSSSALAPLAVGVTDAKGRATLRIAGLPRLSGGTLLTVTGYNAETFQAKLVP